MTVHKFTAAHAELAGQPPYPILCNDSGTEHRQRVSFFWRFVNCPTCLKRRARKVQP